MAKLRDSAARQGVVAALVKSIFADHFDAEEQQLLRSDATLVSGAADFVGRSQAALPHLMPIGMKVAATGLELLPVFKTGKRYSKLRPEDQLALLRAWRQSPIGPLRTVIKFYSVYALYYYYDAHVGGEIA